MPPGKDCVVRGHGTTDCKVHSKEAPVVLAGVVSALAVGSTYSNEQSRGLQAEIQSQGLQAETRGT